MKCPACRISQAIHTDADCIAILTHRIEKLEKVAKLAINKVWGSPSMEEHRKLMEALEDAGFMPKYLLR